jgi:hypothetical protein
VPDDAALLNKPVEKSDTSPTCMGSPGVGPFQIVKLVAGNAGAAFAVSSAPATPSGAAATLKPRTPLSLVIGVLPMRTVDWPDAHSYHAACKRRFLMPSKSLLPENTPLTASRTKSPWPINGAGTGAPEKRSKFDILPELPFPTRFSLVSHANGPPVVQHASIAKRTSDWPPPACNEMNPAVVPVVPGLNVKVPVNPPFAEVVVKLASDTLPPLPVPLPPVRPKYAPPGSPSAVRKSSTAVVIVPGLSFDGLNVTKNFVSASSASVSKGGPRIASRRRGQ